MIRTVVACIVATTLFAVVMTPYKTSVSVAQNASTYEGPGFVVGMANVSTMEDIDKNMSNGKDVDKKTSKVDNTRNVDNTHQADELRM